MREQQSRLQDGSFHVIQESRSKAKYSFICRFLLVNYGVHSPPYDKQDAVLRYHRRVTRNVFHSTHPTPTSHCYNTSPILVRPHARRVISIVAHVDHRSGSKADHFYTSAIFSKTAAFQDLPESASAASSQTPAYQELPESYRVITAHPMPSSPPSPSPTLAGADPGFRATFNASPNNTMTAATPSSEKACVISFIPDSSAVEMTCLLSPQTPGPPAKTRGIEFFHLSANIAIDWIRSNTSIPMSNGTLGWQGVNATAQRVV
ncbi:Hypothetical predicted protein [Lecanosticta acicola]|uniref:Uncharacterized protein n=1 Tax=Lecanosticta acicola TaxID=111012 RepID=A0AAI8Z5W8_9PEZI|nr:Hypothetical predicted protein [Lecanosticta acicola]